MIGLRLRETRRAPGLSQHGMLLNAEVGQPNCQNSPHQRGLGQARQLLEHFDAEEVGRQACAEYEVFSSAAVVALASIQILLESERVLGVSRTGDKSHLVAEIAGAL